VLERVARDARMTGSGLETAMCDRRRRTVARATLGCHQRAGPCRTRRFSPRCPSA